MLFLKTTDSVYTIFPILTLPYHNRSSFNEKQLTLDSLLSWENLKKKKKLMKPQNVLSGSFLLWTGKLPRFFSTPSLNSYHL